MLYNARAKMWREFFLFLILGKILLFHSIKIIAQTKIKTPFTFLKPKKKTKYKGEKR